MSINVYVEGWDKHEVTTNIYADEFYNNMSPQQIEDYCSQDPFCERDENGRIILFKESKSVDENGVEFPFPNFSNSNFSHLLNFIDPSNTLGLDRSVDGVSFDDLPRLRNLIMKRMNGKAMKGLGNDSYESSGIIQNFIAGNQYTMSGCEKLLASIAFAQSRNVGIYWA